MTEACILKALKLVLPNQTPRLIKMGNSYGFLKVQFILILCILPKFIGKIYSSNNTVNISFIQIKCYFKSISPKSYTQTNQSEDLLWIFESSIHFDWCTTGDYRF